MWKSGLQKVQQQIQEVLDCYVSELPPDAIAGAETPLISHDEQASRGNSEQGEAGTAAGQRLCMNSSWLCQLVPALQCMVAESQQLCQKVSWGHIL